MMCFVKAGVHLPGPSICAASVWLAILLGTTAGSARADVATNSPASSTNRYDVKSPNGELQGIVFVDPAMGLSYELFWKGKATGGVGHIGLRLSVSQDKGIHEIGRDASFGPASRGSIDEQYAFRGAKATAENKANTLTVPVRETDGARYTLEVRTYDDGFAWRLSLGDETSTVRVLSETSTWVLPEGKVWFGERNNDWKLKSYAGEFRSVSVDDLATVSSQGPIQTAPLVVELPGRAGYQLVTEAALANYSGMRFRATSGRTLHVDFTEGSEGFEVDGPLLTPWRVTMLCPDLNCLVNNTLTENLNPPPDPALFRDTSYIHGGRFVWRYMSRETGTPAQEMEFVDFAVALGYEYTLIDDGWESWAMPWRSMKDVATYARPKGVGVFAWKNSNEIDDPLGDYAAVRAFLDHAVEAGLSGVKIDFINGEAKKKIDFERRVLDLCAERRLMIDFHGLQKPTGEERTFPNGMSREAVRGIELNRMAEGPLPASHNAALPFTRFAVGPADYTPVNLQWPGTTTWTHQLATAILLSSPWLVIAEDPEFLLKNPDTAPALSVFRNLPTTWDETIVLPGSEIGGVIGMARRKGSTWFIAIINGSARAAAMPAFPSEIVMAHYVGTVIASPEKRSFVASEYVNAGDWHYAEILPAGGGLVVVLKSNYSVLP
jgi:alpha-glucosidase